MNGITVERKVSGRDIMERLRTETKVIVEGAMIAQFNGLQQLTIRHNSGCLSVQLVGYYETYEFQTVDCVLEETAVRLLDDFRPYGYAGKLEWRLVAHHRTKRDA